MNREQILATKTTRSEQVEVPEWGGTFTVRSLSAADRVRFFDFDTDEIAENPARAGVLLLIACIYDDQGERVFKPEDAPSLETQDGAIINRLAGVANRLNGIGDEAAELVKKK